MRTANFYDKKTKSGLYKIRTYTERLKECFDQKDMKKIFLGIRDNRFTFYYYGYTLLSITMKNNQLIIITRNEFSSDAEANQEYAEVMKKIPLVRNYKKEKIEISAHKINKHYEIYESDYIQPELKSKTYSIKILMSYLFTELMKIMEKHFKFQEKNERAIQNRYMTEYSPNDDIYVIDMEFCLPGSIQKKIQKTIHGRYDMIALKHLHDNNYKLVFIELKSAKKACIGKSGINSHIKDMKEFLDEFKNSSDLKNEFEDFVLETLNTRKELKFIPNIEYLIDYDNPEFWLLFDMIDNTDCSSVEKIEKIIKENLSCKNEEFLKIYNGNILNNKHGLKIVEK